MKEEPGTDKPAELVFVAEPYDTLAESGKAYLPLLALASFQKDHNLHQQQSSDTKKSSFQPPRPQKAS